MTDSNCRPPRCKRDALPTELIAQKQNIKRLAYSYANAIVIVYSFECKVNTKTAHNTKVCVVARAGIEPATQGFSVLCSTN